MTIWVERGEGRAKSKVTPSHKKKKIRVGGPYLHHDIYHKASRLSKVCGISIPVLLEEMATLLLNRSDFVNFIQDKYNIEHSDSLRLRLIVENGKIFF